MLAGRRAFILLNASSRHHTRKGRNKAMHRKLLFGAGAIALAVGASGLLGGLAFASGAPVSVSSVTLSGSLSSPTMTITGSGFGASPTGGVAAGPLPNCGNGTWTGKDYPAGKLWFDDANASETWTAGALNGTGGDCVGWVIDSYSAKKIVLSFGTAYGSFGWTLHDSDQFVLSIKGEPFNGSVPSNF
jgi:hypothetical protein